MIFRLYFRVIVKPNYLQACSDLYRKEKEIDVINYTGKGKYEALYLHAIVFTERQSVLSMPGTTVQFWFFELYVHVELPETIKDLSYYSGEDEEF